VSGAFFEAYIKPKNAKIYFICDRGNFLLPLNAK